MRAATSDKIDKCTHCGMSLPLRRPRPGETASSWRCTFCNERFFAVLDDSHPSDTLNNVSPADDINPRVVLGGQTLTQLHKREGRPSRVFDERQAERKPTEFALTIEHDGGQVRIKTLDLSAGGLACVTPQPIEPGTVITILFHSLPGTPRSKGIIRSCAPFPTDQYRIGVKFLPYAEGEPDPAAG